MNVFISITDFPVGLPNAAGVLLSLSQWNFVLRRKRREEWGGRRKQSWRRRRRINRASDDDVTTGSGSGYLTTSTVKITWGHNRDGAAAKQQSVADRSSCCHSRKKQRPGDHGFTFLPSPRTSHGRGNDTKANFTRSISIFTRKSVLLASRLSRPHAEKLVSKLTNSTDYLRCVQRVFANHKRQILFIYFQPVCVSITKNWPSVTFIEIGKLGRFPSC